MSGEVVQEAEECQCHYCNESQLSAIRGVCGVLDIRTGEDLIGELHTVRGGVVHQDEVESVNGVREKSWSW